MEPVRILQINYSMDLGGAETLIMNIYRKIDRSKVQFDFLLHCPEESAYEKEINSLGGRIFRLPRYKVFNKLSYERHLKCFLEDHPEFEIIHAHMMDSASETLRTAKKLGRKTIAHSHTAGVPFSTEEMIRFFFRRNLWKIADYRFACSEEAGKWLYRNKADFMVLRNGIETEKYRFDERTRKQKRDELGIPETARVIGTVGRMVKYKNQTRLPYIMKRLAEMDDSSLLLLVGFGPLEVEIKDKAKALGVSDRIIMTGPRKDVCDLLMAMDVFVLPSLFEGLGIALVEAQASGLPCVFTDSIPEDVNLIPDLIHRISLSDSDVRWAEEIRTSQPLGNRENAFRLVADSGYDIRSSAKQLQEFYLSI